MKTFTDEDRARGKLATQARHAAMGRLKKIYANDLDAFEREERVARGLPAEKNKGWKTVSELKSRIAELESQLEGGK